MYCVFNATTVYDAGSGNPLGWPFENQYGYFCDQRDRSLFMLANGYANMFTLVGAYLVTVLYLGPRFMENRKPLEIRPLIRFYNLAMILANAYLIHRALSSIDYGRSFFNCKGVEVDFGRVDEIATLTELFLLSRLADFLDTLWFVLRKKHGHISFLHVFHHSYVPLVAYSATRWEPVVPNAMSFPFVNAGVHVVMYAYYFLATFPALRPHLWWKRYLTGLQMTQFVLVLVYNIIGFFFFSSQCGKSQITNLVSSLISAAIFLMLFYSFYRKAYTKPAEGGQVKAATPYSSGSQLASSCAHKQHQHRQQTTVVASESSQSSQLDADQRERKVK